MEYHDWYARKMRDPISKELVFGRAYHGTLEDALVEKMWNGMNIHPDALQERWHMRWLLEMREGKDIEWKGMPGESPEDFFNIGSGLVKYWRENYLPGLKPLDGGVETSFWLPLRGVSRALYGKIDLITADGLLVDHKTSSHTWDYLQKSKYFNPQEIDLQMCIYHAAYEAKVKDWPRSCELHRAVTAMPLEVERIALNYTPEEVQHMFDKVIKPAIKEIDQMWAAGIFPCRCKKHTPVAATAPRPVATVAEGYAAGTTGGPVTVEEAQTDDGLLNPQKVLRNPLDDRAPLPPVDINIEEIPF